MHDTPQHHSSTVTSTSTSTFTPSSAPGQGRGAAPHDRVRRELRFWAYLAVAALSAILVPVVVVVAVHLTDEGGLARAFTAWLIAMLGGLAVYAAAAAPHAAHRIR